MEEGTLTRTHAHELTSGHPFLSLFPVVSQEVLQERLRRHGEDSPFGHFLQNETSRMATCLHKMHSSLQVHLLHHSDVILIVSYGGVDDVIGDGVIGDNVIGDGVLHVLVVMVSMRLYTILVMMS